MSAISWNESVPSPSSAASSGDDEIRSLMTSVALGLSTSFIWPGSGGGSGASGGVSQFGNARCAVAGNSAATGGYGDGFLLLNQNHISLHHIGSTWTGLLGHSSMVEHSAGSTGAVAFWRMQSGVFSLQSSADSHFGNKQINFPVPFSGTTAQPGVFFLPNTLSYAVNISLSSTTAGGFTSQYSGLSATESDTSVFWLSIGT